MCHCTPGVRTPCCGEHGNCHAKLAADAAQTGKPIECHIHKVTFHPPARDDEPFNASMMRELAARRRKERIDLQVRWALKEIKKAAETGVFETTLADPDNNIVGKELIDALLGLGFNAYPETNTKNQLYIVVSWAPLEHDDPFPSDVKGTYR